MLCQLRVYGVYFIPCYYYTFFMSELLKDMYSLPKAVRVVQQMVAM